MFKTPEARTALRAGLATLLSVLSAAGAIWVGNPYIALASSGLATLALWYGVGAVTPTEPFLGSSDGKVEVPRDKVTPVG